MAFFDLAIGKTTLQQWVTWDFIYDNSFVEIEVREQASHILYYLFAYPWSFCHLLSPGR
jgi:hypothetical protein